MAVVLDALASYIQNMLMEMMKEQVHMLLGVPSEVEKMKTKLIDLKQFLADADRRNITDETVGGWVKEFRDAMYEATDILDSCQLKAMEKGPSPDMGCFNPFLFFIRNPLHAHNIGNHLKVLNEKIEDIGRRGKTFNFIELGRYEDHITKKESSSRVASRETTGELDQLDLVGEKIEENTRNLVELLTRKEETNSERNKIMIFAIVGVGGIGKTTLAQNIFNQEIIQQEFEKKIWLSVNQNYNELDLLKRAITEARGNHIVAGNTKATLVQILKEALKGYKILLVMDDVWNHEVWELFRSPLKNVLAQGSRILITTRHDMVARGMMANEPYHHVDKLEQEDAWSLLKKQVVKNENDESRIDRLVKDIGMGIVARCDGLPLAIKAMGGLLRQKKIKQSDWENVLHDPIWSEESHMTKDLNNAIYLSYQELPSYLKPCFLHFSLLPKSIIFSVDVIVGMWISEGFVHGDSRNLEELGREYYDELILRNLIDPSIIYIDQGVCRMHDIVRSFAQYVARDEALAGDSTQTDIICKLNSQKLFRRISIETKGSQSEQLEWMSLQTQMSLRTLILVGPIKIKPQDSLVNFPSLRSLHVEYTNFDALAKSLVHLKHLRYLCIGNTDTSMLPENIGDKMKFLQSIVIFGCRNLVKLPGSIEKLRHLRHLDLNSSTINNVPKGFRGLTNLRKLYGFPAHMDGDWCSLEALGPLSNLIELHIKGLENISSSLFATKARLCEKDRLRYLDLIWTSKDGDDGNLNKRQQMEEFFDKLCPPPCLESLDITGYFGSRLPTWMITAAVASLGSLRNLMMEDLPYCMELPDSLCQLPCLEFLKIENAPLIKSIGSELLQSYNHEHMSSSLANLCSVVKLQVARCPGLMRIGNLPKTEALVIIKCPNLKVLDDMPVLQRLTLEDYKMKRLPSYLQDIKPIHLHVDCDISLLSCIAIGKSGPEWDKFSHVWQVKAYANDNDNNITRKWHVKYTRDPFSFKTNIGRSHIDEARRRRVQHLRLAYHRTCPVEEKPTAGHPLCQRFRCNAYRHLVRWLQEACLHCCEADGNAVPSDQWIETAVCGACRIVRLTPKQFARRGGE